MKIKHFITKNIYFLMLFLLVALLFATNYKSGTYLIGWDSLQTELNPMLAVKRALFSGWQEYQGLGLASGMAHTADLIRALFMLAVSFVLPQALARYFFHFMMLFIGGAGLFVLLRYTHYDKEKQPLAFIGAVFYILNLGTVQIFSLPFEPFSVFFGLLPWEIYAFLIFFHAPKITVKELFMLFIINLLATPQSYLQTLFVVYFLCLGFLGLGLLIENFGVKSILRLVTAFSLIIIVNLFWMLPQVYFVNTSIATVRESKINQLATDIVSRQNSEKGTIKSIARLEGFYYDLSDTNDNMIFKPWHEHFSNFFVRVFSYVPFLLLSVGLFRRRKNHLAFLLVFILVSLTLLSNTKALAFLNFAAFTPTFLNQIFRSPFTKFIVPYTLVYTYFFISGLEYLYIFFTKSTKDTNRVIETIIFNMVVVLFIVIYSLPSFMGSYFAVLMKTSLPQEYADVISYFKGQDKNARIALLPDYTFWGWFRTKWGYDGSGFIWYGIEQPIISRTFDVWNLKSESYYWELKYAIESINKDLFENVLEKYNVDYLLLDKALLPISSVPEGMQYDQLEKMLAKSDKIQLEKTFGDFVVYKVSHPQNVDHFIALADKLPSAGPAITITNKDQAYVSLGSYKTQKQPDYYYPFLDLISQTELKNKKWTIIEDGRFFVLKANLKELNLKDYVLDENTVPLEATVFQGTEVQKYNYDIQQEIVGNEFVVKLRKDMIEKFDPTFVGVNNCRGIGDFGVIKRGSTLAVTSGERGTACFGYESRFMAHWNGYLVKLESDNVKGKELFFYIFGNRSRKQSRIETNLQDGVQYFVINPSYYYDDGYYFSFQNTSYKSQESENMINLLEVYLFPFDYLKNIRLVRKDMAVTPAESLSEVAPELMVEGTLDAISGLESAADVVPTAGPTAVTATKYNNLLQVYKKNYYTYMVEKNEVEGADLILYQSFDPGWYAYKISAGKDSVLHYLSWKKIATHHSVNNWANGWSIPALGNDDRIILVFWPQYLEYLGFGVAGLLCLIVFPVMFVYQRKKAGTTANI